MTEVFFFLSVAFSFNYWGGHKVQNCVLVKEAPGLFAVSSNSGPAWFPSADLQLLAGLFTVGEPLVSGLGLVGRTMAWSEESPLRWLGAKRVVGGGGGFAVNTSRIIWMLECRFCWETLKCLHVQCYSRYERFMRGTGAASGVGYTGERKNNCSFFSKKTFQKSFELCWKCAAFIKFK